MTEKPKGIPHRWNWQEAVDGAEVCRGEHDRNRECEWETWDPEGAHSGDVTQDNPLNNNHEDGVVSPPRV